jgi:hypothetical protein
MTPSLPMPGSDTVRSLYSFPTGVLNSFYGYVNNDNAIPTYINVSSGTTTETVN